MQISLILQGALGLGIFFSIAFRIFRLNIFESVTSRSLSRAPIAIDDSSRLIVQRWQADTAQSKFIITGKGGLPSNPHQVITDSIIYDILGEVKPVIFSSQSLAPQPEKKLGIFEANNWVTATDGGISLIANQPNTLLRLTNINSLTSCKH